MKKLCGFLILTALFCCLAAEIIQIGGAMEINQGLPWSVKSRYSYVQQIYPAGAIGVGGVISSIGFQYNVGSAVYFESNRDLRILMGHSQSESPADWIPVEELTEVFNGQLQLADYSAGLPGTGWLTIMLSTAFDYDNSRHLVIAIDENSHGYGSTLDDFYVSPQTLPRSRRFRSMSINPEPENPPTEGVASLNYLANLRLDIHGQFYQPYAPQPADSAINVAVNTAFAWQSDALSFDLYLGAGNAELSLVAQGLSSRSWQPPTALEEAQSDRWQVVGHRGQNQYPGPVWSFGTVGAPLPPPQGLTGYFDGSSVQLSWQPIAQGVSLYQVWRDGILHGVSGYSGFRDQEISSHTSYSYRVRAVATGGGYSAFSEPYEITVGLMDPLLIFREGFESYPAFSTVIGNWINLDTDGSATWSWDSHDFPGEGGAMGWMVFAPGQMSPPLTSVAAYSGVKMLVSMSSMSPPSGDWLISPVYNLGMNPSLIFRARSHTSAYGLERLRVLLSTGGTQPGDFVPISPAPYIQVPAEWTQYSFLLPEWQGQSVRLAFEACSWDAFALYLDEIELRGEGGSPVEDEHAVSGSVRLYPNPARSFFKLESSLEGLFDVSIFDLRGRLVHRQRATRSFDTEREGLSLSSGIYFVRVARPDGKLIRTIRLIWL